MIKSFADRHTLDLYQSGRSKRLPPDLWRRAVRKLEQVDYAASIEDLKTPPSNRLHALKGNRQGHYAISVNEQWRICFRYEAGDAFSVEIRDYH